MHCISLNNRFHFRRNKNDIRLYCVKLVIENTSQGAKKICPPFLCCLRWLRIAYDNSRVVRWCAGVGAGDIRIDPLIISANVPSGSILYASIVVFGGILREFIPEVTTIASLMARWQIVRKYPSANLCLVLILRRARHTQRP